MSFALLAKRPSQKKRPTHAPPAIPIAPIHSDTQVIPVIQTTTTTRRRSATVSAIAAWVAQIQPGSPAPLTPRVPCTPCTPRTPRSARSSGHRRHRSFSTSSRVPRLGSPTLVQLDSFTPTQTPSPSGQPPAAVSLDLLAQGYTSFVVRLPVQSPVAPRTLFSVKSYQDIKSIPIPPIPLSPVAAPPSEKELHSRSFSLKSARSFMMLAHKPKSSHTSHHSSKSKSSTPQARYGHLMAPCGGAGALPLAAEVQLSQMLDGGSLDANVKRVAARHAKDTGAVARKKDRGVEVGVGIERKERSTKDRSKSSHATSHHGNVMGVDGKVGGGVSGIYRDGEGGMYWDEDEVWELEGLLKEEDNNASPIDTKRPALKKSGKSLKDGFLKSSSKSNAHAHHTHSSKNQQHNPDWVTLDQHQHQHRPSVNTQAVSPLRRESIISSASSGSRDSDLDLGYTVRPRDAYGDTPGMEAHMRRRADALDAFSLAGAERAGEVTTGAAPRARPRPRQRPAPLALALEEVPPHVVPTTQPPTKHHSSRSHRSSSRHTHGSAHTVPPPPLPTAPCSTPGTAMASEGKKDFFASSFAPAPAPAPAPTAHQASSPFPQFAPPATGVQDTSKAQGRRGSLTALVGALALGGKAGRRASLTPVSPNAYTHHQYHAAQPYGYGYYHGHGSSVASASTTSLKSKNSKTSNIMGLFKR